MWEVGDASVKPEIVEPNPGALIESLRAFGYSLRTAIADLIDNSISAGSRNIHLAFHWAGSDSYILLEDDGGGMTEAVLKEAMRLGSRSPVEVRAPHDLGRFGLGMKTASFSQCRRLTVTSRMKGAKQITRRWDLDHVVRRQKWELLAHPADGSETRLPTFEHGTAVLWECMDRVVPPGTKAGDDKRMHRYWEMAEEVKQHLRVVFHRCIEGGSAPRIYFNRNRLTPWDPFKHGGFLNEENLLLDGVAVQVRAFVLPHPSKLSPDEQKEAEGLRGWPGQQGFYVYRADRLLVAGDWLGLGFLKEDHHRLARLQVVIPNSMDSAWTIDVRKSRAAPPPALRERLHDLAKITRNRAADVFRHRGKLIGKHAQDPGALWQRRVKNNRVFFTVNREHPLVVAAMGGGAHDAVSGLLRLLEETVPAQTIVIDNSERPDSISKPFEHADEAEVMTVLRQVYASLRTVAMLDPAAARQRLSTMEVFSAYPTLIAALPDNLSSGDS
jgi:hypothetical protein